MEFNRYLELLRLKGGHAHIPHTPRNAHLKKKDLNQKMGKLQVPMYDGKNMTSRDWLNQL